MNTTETWRLVPSLPGLLASSHGRLMVVPYRAPVNRGHGTRHYGGHPTHGQWDGTRFIYLFRGKSYRVARLICEAFHGEPPSNNLVCMHLDEDSRNNRPQNLAWGTQRENLNAPGFLEYCRNRTGDQSPWTKGQQRKRMEREAS